MITRTIGTKKYTLEKMTYENVVSPIFYLQFRIDEDIEFGVNTYYYGVTFNEGEMALVLGMLEQNFADYVVNKLIEDNA